MSNLRRKGRLSLSNKAMLIIVLVFVAYFTYGFGNLQRVDRDDALIITKERFQAGLQPYSTFTALGNPVTTGVSSILYSSILNERDLSFVFWCWIVMIFYNGKNFILYSVFIVCSMIFFQRTMMYRLDELYYGIIPAYYGLRIGSGALIALAMYSRIAYWVLAFYLVRMRPLEIVIFVVTIFSIAMTIDPRPFIENNFKMIHFPKYWLDYSLLFILPPMLYFNNTIFHIHRYNKLVYLDHEYYILGCKCGARKKIFLDVLL